MADLKTKYLGLELKNPIIVGSCSLTESVEDIVQLEQSGAAAIVLKSIFEEEIINEAVHDLKDNDKSKVVYSELLETLEYIGIHADEKQVGEYLKLIQDVKKKTRIPIIASINCINDIGWTHFASKIQDAGADALELNISLNPMDITHIDYKKLIQKIISKVLTSVSIPVSVKLGDCFTNLSDTIIEISKSGIKGLVLFNRLYTHDIDIYNLDIKSGRIHSCETEYTKPLRWISLLSDKINCSIAACTGIHDANTIIKQILAGADAVQIVSTLYLNGKSYINQMLTGIDKWMLDKGYFSISQFKGLASYKKATDPEIYERVQFMKHFGRIG